MANTIAKAVAYINDDAELQKIYGAVSYTADLVKPNKVIGADTIQYRKTTLGSSVLGTYNRDTGYVATDINVTWVSHKLTQDMGNSLHLDKMDGEEAQALELASVVNKYIREVQIPSVDKYRFAQIVADEDVESATGSLTKANVEDALDTAIDHEKNLNVTAPLLCYISVSTYRLLVQATKTSGRITMGAWNGDASTEVKLYGDSKSVKLVEVPDAILGSGVHFIVTPAESICAFVKYQENAYFDKIAGFGGRKAEADIGIYHDCWVEEGAQPSVYVHKAS